MVFILSALWWIQIRGLWKITDGTEWLWGKLGLILMGGAVFPPCCLTWDQSMVEVMKITATSFKRPHASTCSVPPTLQQATANPCLWITQAPLPWQGCDPWRVRVPSIYINVGKHSSNMEKVPKVPSGCLFSMWDHHPRLVLPGPDSQMAHNTPLWDSYCAFKVL